MFKIKVLGIIYFVRREASGTVSCFIYGNPAE